MSLKQNVKLGPEGSYDTDNGFNDNFKIGATPGFQLIHIAAGYAYIKDKKFSFAGGDISCAALPTGYYDLVVDNAGNLSFIAMGVETEYQISLYRCYIVNNRIMSWVDIRAGQSKGSGGNDYLDSVIDRHLLDPPGAPAVGATYGVGWAGGVALNAWATHELAWARWNGSTWDFAVPTAGTICFVDDEDLYYMFDGAAWNVLGVAIAHSLDASYDDGRTVTVDAGPIILNDAVNDATNALEINRTVGSGNAISALGPSLFTGQVTVTDGVKTTIAGLPVAAVGYEGVIFTVPGGAGVKSKSYICQKNELDVYLWMEVSTMGEKIVTKTIELMQAANTYDLFTGTGGDVELVALDFKNVNLNVADDAVITGISIQTDDATPQAIIPQATGVKANITAEACLSWIGSVIVKTGKKVQITIYGGASDVSTIPTVYAKFNSVVNGQLV